MKSSFSYNLSQVLLKCPCSLPFLSFLRSLWINWHALRVPGCSRTKSARSKMILNLVLAIENDRDGTLDLDIRIEIDWKLQIISYLSINCIWIPISDFTSIRPQLLTCAGPWVRGSYFITLSPIKNCNSFDNHHFSWVFHFFRDSNFNFW